ncbi:Uncharacterized protein Adt_12883 [Abeliophyllum distichum]|uniref:Uncharacterized protein n=1 Tax=Abeliophyllum distichum TaxID=126358 RepID=A0ABD1TV92_9LAMI
MNVVVLDSSSEQQDPVMVPRADLSFDSLGSIELMGEPEIGEVNSYPRLDNSQTLAFSLTSRYPFFIITLHHFVFRRARDQMERLEKTIRITQERDENLQKSLKTIFELEKVAIVRKNHLQHLARTIKDQEESLKTRDEKI